MGAFSLFDYANMNTRDGHEVIEETHDTEENSKYYSNPAMEEQGGNSEFSIKKLAILLILILVGLQLWNSRQTLIDKLKLQSFDISKSLSKMVNLLNEEVNETIQETISRDEEQFNQYFDNKFVLGYFQGGSTNLVQISYFDTDTKKDYFTEEDLKHYQFISGRNYSVPSKSGFQYSYSKGIKNYINTVNLEDVYKDASENLRLLYNFNGVKYDTGTDSNELINYIFVPEKFYKIKYLDVVKEVLSEKYDVTVTDYDNYEDYYFIYYCNSNKCSILLVNSTVG